MLLVFFSQAQDGIRAHCVTGVQTCALPISDPAELELAIRAAARGERFLSSAVSQRSEERRVGKECRCRGWSCLYKTQKCAEKWRDGALSARGACRIASAARSEGLRAAWSSP